MIRLNDICEDKINLPKIGEGGNAEVFSIEHNCNKYALKILKKENISSTKKQRFENEIKFCTNNTHNNIIKIYDFGKINNKYCYIMPFYPKTLKNIIEEESDLKVKFNYILQICEGIKFLHEKGVIHRDLKPENILINGNELVIADLGIAHFIDCTLTKEKDLLANRNYASPEQKIKGLSKEITKAADIFSFGLIINEIFTSQKPEGFKFLLISDKYPWLIDLDKIVEKCLRQIPEERFTIDELYVELKIRFYELSMELDNVKKFLEKDFKNINYKNKCDTSLKNKIIE